MNEKGGGKNRSYIPGVRRTGSWTHTEPSAIGYLDLDLKVLKPLGSAQNVQLFKSSDLELRHWESETLDHPAHAMDLDASKVTILSETNFFC